MGLTASRPTVPVRRVQLAGCWVSLSEPTNPCGGVTFLLPGAMLSESAYESTRRVLCDEQGQVVISFYINVLTKKAHVAYAEDVDRIFAAYCAQHYGGTSRTAPTTFSIVGHSVGGKIALLVAANRSHQPHDVRRASLEHQTPRPALATLLALDPVDQQPVVFTNDDATSSSIPNRELPKQACRTWILTYATATPSWAGIAPAHNACAVAQDFPWIQLVTHAAAAHMAYTDNCGGVLGWLMRGGTRQGNATAHEDAHALIRRYIES
jgi:pimeloyl-ACP methyl ester carboxylesterase